MSTFTTDCCGQLYKTKAGFDKHKCKKKTPQITRKQVWDKYAANGACACYSCGAQLHPLSAWECGHIKAAHSGGADSVDNLAPVCSGCNKSTGTREMTPAPPALAPFQEEVRQLRDDLRARKYLFLTFEYLHSRDHYESTRTILARLPFSNGRYLSLETLRRIRDADDIPALDAVFRGDLEKTVIFLRDLRGNTAEFTNQLSRTDVGTFESFYERYKRILAHGYNDNLAELAGGNIGAFYDKIR